MAACAFRRSEHELGASFLPGVGLSAKICKGRVKQAVAFHEIWPRQAVFQGCTLGCVGQHRPFPASISSRHRSQAKYARLFRPPSGSCLEAQSVMLESDVQGLEDVNAFPRVP